MNHGHLSPQHPRHHSLRKPRFIEHRTRLTATVKYPSREIRDMVIKSGMSKGAGISYDRLEDLLARLQRS